MYFGTPPFRDEADAAVVGNSLRENSTLSSLVLHHQPQLAPPVAATLLGALVGHRSLEALTLSMIRLEDPAAAGAALAALLAADAPALKKLTVRECGLGEDGLGAVLDALPRNSHLRELNILDNGVVPAGFMRARLLPAVRANVSLRVLLAGDEAHIDDSNGIALEEAQRIIAAR